MGEDALGPQFEQQVAHRVRNALTDSDRNPPYRGDPNPLTGHCYVASEAAYHVLGGKDAGWKPMFVRHEGAPHWFLRNERSGQDLDITAGQFRTTPDYAAAKGKGFLTRDPSKRALSVIERMRGDQ